MTAESAGDFDVAIVGAGAAGIAAARSAAGRGLRFVVLEAQGRIGGRAHTDRHSIGLPWDRGCQFFHSADINPLVAWADALGVAYDRSTPRWFGAYVAGVAAEPQQLAEIEAHYEACWSAALVAGEGGRDIAMTDVIDGDSPWRRLFDYWCSVFTGVEPDRASTLDFANYRDTHLNFPVRGGYGSLMEKLGAGVPVHLDTPVTAIDWSGAGVRLATAAGTVTARAAVITASTGVLQAEMIRFVPSLPDWKRDAIAQLPLGTANKIALRIAPGALDALAPYGRIHIDTGIDLTFGLQIRPFGREMVVGYAGGRSAVALEEAGEAAMKDFTIDQLAAVVGNDIRRRIVAAAATGWCGDRYIRGAHSMAVPGGGRARKPFAAAVGDRIFFAGEAASADFYSTTHGAWLSGCAAVDAAAITLGANRKSGVVRDAMNERGKGE